MCMNTNLILETSHRSLAGGLSFPDVVRALTEAGVESYRADYATLTSTYYGANGAVVIAPISYEGLPAIAANFSIAELKAAILDSQRNGQKYRDFTHRAISAGVQSYVAFLQGQRVIYTGRHGDQHIKWFPGAAPSDKQS
jgi:uncharacterized protein YbcV (DUF1398 family)